MYYKNKENQPYFEPSKEIIKRDGLVEITKEEFEQIVYEINNPTPEQVLQQQIQEAKTYLASTAWYVERLNDPSSGKAIPEEVLAKRAEARELINTLEVELGGL